jgi:two-component system LytT family sensor kinase
MASVSVVVICLALGLISALEARHVSISHGHPMGSSIVLASTTPRWILLALVLPFVLRLAVRYPLVPWRSGVVALHLAVFFVISFAHALMDTWALGIASPMLSVVFPLTARVTRSWYSTLPTVISMYGAVLVAAWGMTEARERQRRTLRASQLETMLKSAQLAALRAQLQPHFLYNTLNGIAALVADVQPARAVAAIEQLGELLHASLRDDGREQITVDEEVALAERYLALQAMRFNERLRYEWQVAPAVANCRVPVFLLQPIVENAVVHGLDSGLESLTVRIDAVRVPEGIEITVENDGTSLAPGESRTSGRGLGLSATRARLATAYGDRASLELLPRRGGGVIVRIVIPQSGEIVLGATLMPVAALRKVS